jgi:hypothetical protein
MLALPEVHLRRSIEAHNSRLSVFCDWLEACTIFDQREVSSTEAVDMLIEEQIYDSQDFAREFVSQAFSEISRRASLYFSPHAFRVQGGLLICDGDWTDDPAHAFCLLLSLAEAYPQWANSFGSDYTEQGELFEILTVESIEALFPKWTVVKTGWSKAQAVKLEEVITDLVNRLCEVRGAEIARWIRTDANEAGVDLVAYRDLGDDVAGFPVMMFQCASGRNWTEKVGHPNFNLWRSAVSFAALPLKAFAMPFAIDPHDLRSEVIKVGGPFFERSRLLSARRASTVWPSDELEAKLLDWVWPRIASLPFV